MTDPSALSRVTADAAALFEAAGLGTWSWDRARDEVVWSPLLAALHGRPPTATAGITAECLELIHPEDRDGFLAAIRATLESGDDHAVEYRIVGADAAVRWVRSWGCVQRGADGEVTGLLGVAMDITDRKTAETALRERERLFRAVFDSAATGIAIARFDGVWVGVNGALRAMLGYEADEPFPPSFQAITHPDDVATDEAFYRRLVAGEIGRYALEKRYLRKDGAVVWVNITVSLVPGDDGEPRYGLAIVENISERKAAEAERDRLLADLAAERTLLETTLEHLPVAVAIADAATGRLALANARMDALVGETSDPTALPTLLDAADVPLAPAEHPLRSAIAEGRPVGGVEVRLARRDGTTAALVVNAAPIRGADGAVVAGVGTFDDVTDRRRADDRRSFLAEASELLAASLGDASTLERLAATAVPALADLCIIDLVQPDGTSRTVALVGRRAAAVRALDAAFPPGPAGGNPMVVAALRTGAVQWQPELDDAALERVATSPGHLALLRELGPTAAVSAPLAARGRTLGALTLMMTESGRRFHEGDRRLAEELARRLALAVDNARLLDGEQAARRQAEATTERMARLQRLTASLATATTTDEVAGIVLDEGIAALGAWAGSLALVDRDQGGLTIARAVGYPAPLLDTWRHVPIESSTALAEAARTGLPILLGSRAAILERYPGLAEPLAKTETQAQAAIPIVSGGETLAVIGLSFAEPRPFRPETRALLEAVAHQSALALGRARLLEAERRARAEAEGARGRLAFLAEASAALGSSLDYQATMRRLAGLLTPRLADWAAIHLVTPEGRVELLELAHGDPAQADLASRLEAHYRAEPLSASVRRVLETGEAVLVPEITEEMLDAGGHEPGHRDLLRRVGMTSAMIVPLAARDEALGAISLVRAGGSPRYAAEDLAFAVDLAGRAAVAIANARHYLAEERARRDAEASARRTARLQAITAALSGAPTQEAVAAVLIEQGSAALGAMGGMAAVADGVGGFRIVHSTDLPDDIVDRWRRFRADADIAIARRSGPASRFCCRRWRRSRGATPTWPRTGSGSATRPTPRSRCWSIGGRSGRSA
jgi:PAS domain S-box-containing protein